MAVELAPHNIRVNTVNPCTVDTDLVHNRPTYQLFAPDLENPDRDQIGERMGQFTALATPWVESRDVSAAVAFLASEEARFITGVALPIDAGVLAK
jgi:(+)-trans-carveol dehydrogenase